MCDAGGDHDGDGDVRIQEVFSHRKRQAHGCFLLPIFLSLFSLSNTVSALSVE